MPRLILGTRGSPLALWQAHHVADRLAASHPDLTVEMRTIKTEGDVRRDVPFGRMPGRGFFVKEIEEALVRGTIDLAVHSLKDLPTDTPRGLAIAAVLERHDPRDAILTESGRSFDRLPAGTVVATGSLRRRCQLLHARPDLRSTSVRGNVDTRVRKLREGRFGALVLALAGVQRLGIDSVPAVPIPTEICVPAVGQGALALETRSDDRTVLGLVEPLTHAPTWRAATAERAFLARLGGGCLAPATAFAEVGEERIRVIGIVGDPDGGRLLRERVEGPPGAEESLGVDLAERLLGSGGDEILRETRDGADGHVG